MTYYINTLFLFSVSHHYKYTYFQFFLICEVEEYQFIYTFKRKINTLLFCVLMYKLEKCIAYIHYVVIVLFIFLVKLLINIVAYLNKLSETVNKQANNNACKQDQCNIGGVVNIV